MEDKNRKERSSMKANSLNTNDFPAWYPKGGNK